MNGARYPTSRGPRRFLHRSANPDGERASTFKRGFMSTFTLDVIGRGLSALATIAFIRALGVSSFAYLVLFLNIGQFAGSALTGGIRMRYMRTEAERVSRGLEGETGFALAMVTSLLFVLGVSVLALLGVTFFESGGSQSDRWLFVALTAAYTAANAAIEMGIFHYQAHLKFVRAGLVGIARGGAIIVVAIAAAFGLTESGPLTAALVTAAIFLVALAVCWPLVRRTLSLPRASSFRGEFGRESAWLTLYYLGSAGFAYADIFIVAGFLDDAAVSSYGAALRYIAIVLGPMPALIAVMRVRTSQRDLVDSGNAQADLLGSWIRRSLLPVTLFIAAAAVAAPFLIPLLDGGRYPDSIPIFQVMLLPALINYLTVPGPNLLMTQRRYRLLAVIYGVALAVQLVAAGGIAIVSGVVAVAAVASFVGALEAGLVAAVAVRLARRRPGVAEAPA
ncbi:MAG: lipopolysaccharide biosynthesis protein [Solirubrobacterales bacterium]